jgi:hypothetical protein
LPGEPDIPATVLLLQNFIAIQVSEYLLNNRWSSMLAMILTSPPHSAQVSLKVGALGEHSMEAG